GSADDQRVMSSAGNAHSAAGLQPLTVSSTGGSPVRVALPSPGDMIILDVARDGRWLLTRDEERYGLVIKKPNEPAEQDVSWLNLSSRGSLSQDGSLLAFSNQNALEGGDYAVMLRKTDGSPPTRLGAGNLALNALSPDNRWVVAELLSTRQFVFYPTGAGDPKTLPVLGDVAFFTGWYPDSEHVLIVARRNGGPARCY